MKKIMSVIAAVLLAGQVGYITTVYAASSQESSKSKQSASKKTNKDKSTKSKSDKNSSKQTEKSKSNKKTASSKKDTTQSNKKTQSTKNNSSVDKSTAASVSKTEKKDTFVTETDTSDVAVTTNPAPIVAPANHTPVDCLYQLSSTAPISEKELAEWAQLAVIKSFDYSFNTLETQLQKLKACYTEQGWLGFNNALKQSGNLATIKAQQLTVSCELEGKLKVNAFKNNQWKITVPLKVVYQNTQEKLTQRLFVEMIVAKKSATQLGIVQIIAEPKSQNTSKEAIAS